MKINDNNALEMKTAITKDQIIELEQKLYQAMMAGNVDVLEQLLHDDLLFVIPSGEVITKEKDLQTYRDGELKVQEIIPNIETVSLINDVAVVVVLLQLKGSYKAQPFDATFRYIRFWKQFSDEIKVIGGSGVAV